MPTTKKITTEEVIAQYADNVITMTAFGNQRFLAHDKEKSIQVLLADEVIKKNLFYITYDYEKIKHNLSFLSYESQQIILNHQNNPDNLKNGYADWFAIGTWICILGCQTDKGKILRAMQLIEYTLDLDLLHKGKLLPVPNNVLAELKKIQAKLLKISPENGLNQYVVKAT